MFPRESFCFGICHEYRARDLGRPVNDLDCCDDEDEEKDIFAN